MSDSDVLKMKVADLKRELKVRGLSTSGNKNELQERLQSALLDGDLTLDDPAISEDLLDEALTDDEDDDKEALDLSNEDAVLQTPDKEEEKNLEEPSPTQQQKKVILKRKNSITVAPSTASTPSSDTATSSDASPPAEKLIKLTADIELSSTDAESKDADGKKVVKLSQLSNKDRLEMRAKKFGISTAAGTETAKLARAERFGQTTTKSDAAASNGTTVVPATSIDVLKKRAERFGGSVSSRMTDLEKKEKLAKRQERFGAGATAVTGSSSAITTTVPEANGSSSSVPSDYAEKAKQRLERFKTAVK